MKAKAVIVSVFALVLASAAVCSEQYRLHAAAAVDDNAELKQVRIATKEVDVTN
jgi:hypothetical protein